MASTADSFIVSPNICSHTDKDGTTILNVERDVLYSVIGVGSMIWKKLAAYQSGLTFDTIIEELSAEFKDVPREQIERDAERLLGSFQRKGLVQHSERKSGPFIQAMHWTSAGSISLSRMMVGLLLKLRLNSLGAF